MSSKFYFRFFTFCQLLLIFPIYGNSQNIFEKTNPSEKIKQEAIGIISSADYYNIDINQLKRTLSTSSTIEITIPIGDRRKTLLLEKTNILTPEYRLYTSSGKTLNTAKDTATNDSQFRGMS